MTSPSVHLLRRNLVAAAFRELGAGKSRFAIDHLTDLLDNRNDLNDLKSSIAGLAIRGGLSGPQPTDEPVGTLLAKLATGKAALGGRVRKASRIGASNEASATGAVPSTWSTVLLSDVVAMHNGFAFKSHAWETSGLPIVRIQNLNRIGAGFNYAKASEVPDRNKIRSGDVLLSWSGTPGTSFGVFIWDRGPAALNQHIFKCEFYGPINTRYFQIAVNEAIRNSLDAAHGGVGLKHLTKGTLDAMPIPIPPRNEQDRIVDAVDDLETRIDRLRELLEDRDDQSDLLLTAVTDTAE